MQGLLAGIPRVGRRRIDAVGRAAEPLAEAGDGVGEGGGVAGRGGVSRLLAAPVTGKWSAARPEAWPLSERGFCGIVPA